MICQHPTLFALCVGLLTSIGCGPSYEIADYEYDPQKSDLENLLGEWVCVEATKAGAPAPDLVGKAIEFQEEMVYMRAHPRDDGWIQTGYVLETENEPKRLVMNATPYGVGTPQLWIDLYRFEKGSLVLSRGEHQVTPLSFESNADNGYSLLVYKRVK